MPVLSRVEGAAFVLISAHALAGKTTLAAGLAEAAKSHGKSVALLRLAGDENASADTALFSRLSAGRDAASADVVLTEAPAGDALSSLGVTGDARAVVVANYGVDAAEIAEYCRPLGHRLAGVVANKVPRRRIAALRAGIQAEGIGVLGLLPEDRLLASPTLTQVCAALEAETLFLNSSGEGALGRILIASISADPAQGYFAGFNANTVLVRSDKPDLQLAALNAGAACLIVTGSFPLLGYVLERAEDDEIPIIRTKKGTIEAFRTIETLYASAPFTGGVEKSRRVSELMGESNLGSLVSSA